MARTALKPVHTIGSLINSMAKIRDQRRDIAEKDKVLKAEYDELELQLIAMLDAQGTTKGANDKYTASISTNVQFNPTDWEKFMVFVARNKRWDLVQRRVSAPAVRELCELKGAVPPGLEPYDQRTISLRSL